MKTTLSITGQAHGNTLLLNGLRPFLFNGQVKKEAFNNYTIEYPSKKLAVISLKNCIKTFNDNRDENERKYGHIQSLSIAYDASSAQIL